MFRFSVVASLLLLGVAAAMWWRSYSRQDVVYYYTKRGTIRAVGYEMGRLFYWRADRLPKGPMWEFESGPAARYTGDRWQGADWSYLAWGQDPKEWHVRAYAGVLIVGDPMPSSGDNFSQIAFPFFYLAMLLTALPLAWCLSYRSRRRRARTASGFCMRCGYDLRASAERCPECGEAISEAQEKPPVGPGVC
jgi:hypothetical protein